MSRFSMVRSLEPRNPAVCGIFDSERMAVAPFAREDTCMRVRRLLEDGVGVEMVSWESTKGWDVPNAEPELEPEPITGPIGKHRAVLDG